MITLDLYIRDLRRLSKDSHVVIGGDFNTMLDIEVDRVQGGKLYKIPAESLQEVVLSNELIDVYRVFEPTKATFTCTTTTKVEVETVQELPTHA